MEDNRRLDGLVEPLDIRSSPQVVFGAAGRADLGTPERAKAIGHTPAKEAVAAGDQRALASPEPQDPPSVEYTRDGTGRLRRVE